MSKDTPEVGDVWGETLELDDGYIIEIKYVIIGKYINGGYYVISENFKESYGFFINEEDFINLKYLGKSKANIDDLFKTENEE